MPLILAMLGLLLTGHSAAAADTTYAEKAAALVQSYVDADRFSGAVLVALDGKPIFRQGFGLANREWGVANTPETKFRTGSIGKQFAAASVLRLAERGKLGLDDPISKHYDAAPLAWSKITLRHLLSMRSGIPNFTKIPDFFVNPSKAEHTPEQVIALTRDQPLRFEPGTRYEYSNSGYILIGSVIEKVTGGSYGRYLRESIFSPLGMTGSGYEDNETVIPNRASGYRIDRGQWKIAMYISMSVVFSAGATFTTVDDLLRWEQALGRDGFLGADSRRAMFTNYGGGYRLAWGISNLFGNPVQMHSGSIHGFHTTLCRYPEDKLTIIVLANLESAPSLWIANELASLHFGILRTAMRPCLYES